MRIDGNHLIFAGFLTMRQLHIPVHPKFIFARDWLLMSAGEKEKAIKEGKINLPSPHEFQKMKSHEFKEWKEKVQPYLDEIHESVIKVFKNFPKSLMLVCRLDIHL